MKDSIYFNTAAPDGPASPHFDADPPPPTPAAHPRRAAAGRRLVLHGALVTLTFMLVFSALAMLVAGQSGYSPRLLIGMPLTFVIMATLAWRAGRLR